MNITKTIRNNAIWMGKTRLAGSIFVGVIVGVCLLGIVTPHTINADYVNATNSSYVAKASNEVKNVVKTIKVVVTAYSSSIEETDNTPFITASGKYVADGIIANNMLPFGTKIKIPNLYGNKIFIVQDRMNKKKSDYHIDIWMPTKPLAVNFGVKTTEIQVLEN